MNRLMASPLAVPEPALALWAHPDAAVVPHTDRSIPTVYLAADLPGAEQLIRTAGWNAVNLVALSTLFDGGEISTPSCLVMDISSFESSALHQRLAGLGAEMTFICTADEVDLAMVVEIVRAGALDVIQKPVVGDALLQAVRRALLRSEAALEQSRNDRRLRDRLGTLSLRERQVMILASSGLLNKQIAAELGISEITVKAHRGRVMRKMEARSFAGLVKMAMVLKL